MSKETGVPASDMVALCAYAGLGGRGAGVRPARAPSLRGGVTAAAATPPFTPPTPPPPPSLATQVSGQGAEGR